MPSVPFLIPALMLLLSSAAFASLKEVPLLKPFEAPIVINGQNVGSIKLPAGASVEIMSDQGAEYTVSRGGQIPFKIPKDYIVAATNATASSQPSAAVVINTAGTAVPATSVQSVVGMLTDQPQTLMEEVMAFVSHPLQTAKENIAYLCRLAGINALSLADTQLSGPMEWLRSLVNKVIPPSIPPVDKKAQKDRLTPQMNAAIERAKAIINQPVHSIMRSPGMKVLMCSPGWFPPAAVKPDFNTVDVRKTQDVHYGNSDYVTSDFNPTFVFAGNAVEFNSMTAYFYTDLKVPKKRLTEAEMQEINALYRVIGSCEKQLAAP